MCYPPGVQREQQVGTVSNVLQNESSLQVQVCGLADGDARAVYKTINLDMRTYKNMNLFVHAESVIGEKALNFGDITLSSGWVLILLTIITNTKFR